MLYVEIAILILGLEIIIIIISFCALIACRIVMSIKEESKERLRKILSSFVVDAVIHPETFSLRTLPYRCTSAELLVTILTEFNQKISDTSWQQLKEAMTEKYLLPWARRYYKSFFWKKRYIAVRSFALNMQMQDKERIFSLLQDTLFLVRIEAALCAIKLHTQEAVSAILHCMKQESELSRLFYKDLFLHDRERDALFSMILHMMPKMSAEEKVICLDILVTCPQKSMLPIALQELSSERENCRLLAVRILAAFYEEESINALITCLNDKNWKVQGEAAISLGKLKATQSIPFLTALLSAESWWVRLQAALALKQMGEKGTTVLFMQDPDASKTGYEMAQYVLSLA